MLKDIYKYEMFGMDEIKTLISRFKLIEGYTKTEPLDGDAAETLSKIIHAQIDWCEGNVTDDEFNKRLEEA